MIDLTKIDKNCIIICPNEKKDELVPLFNSNIEYSVKYISKGELISSLTFTYDDSAVVYLMKKKYSYDNAIEILNNLNFVNKGTDKLDLLVSLKDELIKNKLLKFNSVFKYIFNNKSTYIYGYSKKDKHLESLLQSIKVPYRYISEVNKGYKHKVLEFDNIEDEVSYFFNSVCEKYNSGTPLSDICLYTYPSEYEMILRKYSRHYSLPINFSSNISLVESPIFKEYISLVKDLSLEDGFEMIKDKEDRYNSVPKILNVVNDVLNLYMSKEEKIKLIINKAKNVSLKEAKYKNGIEIVNSSYRGDKHVYILGFSLGSYPKIKKDTDFLLDKEKEICSLNTSKTENSILLEQLENFLSNNENLHISLKKKIGDVVYYDSLLIEKLKYKKESAKKDGVRYSKPLLELEVASYQDTKSDYGIENQFQDGINPKEFRYKEYDHHFKSGNFAKNDEEMRLSFTQIDNFYNCPFKYYVQKILHVDDFETTFFINLGVLFHNVLEDSLKKEVKPEDYTDWINENFTTAGEKFFVNRLFYQAFEVVNKNKAFQLITSFNKEYGEHEFTCRIDEKTTLYGKADHILFNEKEKEVVVVDYKTGAFSFNKKHVEFGICLQLPIYSYLASKTYPTFTPTGIYIQNVLDRSDDINKKYRLKGLSIHDDEKLARLEHGLDGFSNYISGLRKTKNGYQEKGTISKEEYQNLIDTGEQKVIEAISKIRNGEYQISPLIIDNDTYQNFACKYCPLKGICFVKEEDFNKQYTKKDEEEEN